MKERPILFSGPMVRAILSGQKTVTRRVMKPQPQKAPVDVFDGVPSWDSPTNYAGEVQMNTQHGKPCPYGKPGDRLWVREAWAQINVAQAPGESWVVYRECDNRTDYGGPWKPSIHMRRRDSRILLEVTDVRVERLQDISDDQAKAEGMVYTDFGMQERLGKVSLDGGKTFYPMKPQQAPGWHAGGATHPDQCLDRARWAFANLWEKINGEYSWDANPWVWVVEFKRIEP
ncbi:hypothetical protein LU642_16120 [Pseudomonas asiatica]|uniref:hypothetical protein n=1 Tax=Pseudomonas asiatica TaxID=2219225 RepID=UPI001E58EBE9|nr:hypothetical protein [Pseudomonas asiatica]MCE1082120.1 hypothetical protein [Pseudomonas asiatica]